MHTKDGQPKDQAAKQHNTGIQCRLYRVSYTLIRDMVEDQFGLFLFLTTQECPSSSKGRKLSKISLYRDDFVPDPDYHGKVVRPEGM